MWFDCEDEINVGGRPSTLLGFFVVLSSQVSFYSGSCFTLVGLFMDFLCILHRLVQS
jgi:hypothetical protein